LRKAENSCPWRFGRVRALRRLLFNQARPEPAQFGEFVTLTSRRLRELSRHGFYVISTPTATSCRLSTSSCRRSRMRPFTSIRRAASTSLSQATLRESVCLIGNVHCGKLDTARLTMPGNRPLCAPHGMLAADISSPPATAFTPGCLYRSTK